MPICSFKKKISHISICMRLKIEKECVFGLIWGSSQASRVGRNTK